MIPQFVDNEGVRIRYLDSGPVEGQLLPLVFVPGISDTADEYAESFAGWYDRRVLIVEMRGRGGSDAPAHGYSSDAQAGDVEAVLDAAGLGPFHLMTFSRGTTASLRVLLSRPAQVRTLSIGDYLAVELQLVEGFVEHLSASTWRGTPTLTRMPLHALEGIAGDSRAYEFWDDLARAAVPLLVARHADGGIVTDEVEARYRQAVPGVEVVTLPGKGHDLFRSSRTAYPDAVAEFIARRRPGQ